MLHLTRILIAAGLLLMACRSGSAPADAGPATWQTFTGEGFRVQFPGEPAVGPNQRAESDLAGMSLRSVSYQSIEKKTQFGVATFAFPTVPGPIAFGSPLYITVHGRVLKGFNARVLNDVGGTYYGLQGHQFELERPGAPGGPPFRISGRLVVQDKQLFLISVQRELGNADRDAQRFLDSFNLTGL